MYELDAGEITDKTVSMLDIQGIGVKHSIALCYDGAFVMSGKR